jgi:shikimate kinase
MGRKKLGDVMKNIYLIGFMGSGKTTIGRALSECLNISVIDTDEEIIRTTGRSISEIFETEGESYFRILETSTLKKLPNENSIITTGGGIVLSEENRKCLRGNGTVVFLNATPVEVLKRLEGDQSRPLLSGDKKTKVSQILAERMPLYVETANIIIETTGKSVDSIVEELIERLKSE